MHRLPSSSATIRAQFAAACWGRRSGSGSTSVLSGSTKVDRGQGLGTRLLALAEEEGIKRGCISAFLDSLSFQAPDFYLKRGYEIWGELKDLPVGHRRIFLQKKLVPSEDRRQV